MSRPPSVAAVVVLTTSQIKTINAATACSASFAKKEGTHVTMSGALQIDLSR